MEEHDLVDAAAQVSAWCGEPLLYDGDDPAMTLAPGTARRRALDAALEEIAQGLDAPGPSWRFRFSLMLGLERVLAADQPALLNGLTLRPHQVDALAGMLAALTAGEEREADADDAEAEGDDEELELDGSGPAVDELEAEEEDEAEEDEEDEEDEDDEDDEPDDVGPADAAAGAEVDDEGDEESEAAPEPEPDPGAVRRYRFKHPTASGKTVAAAGFVEACRSVGVLILTHRRLLVDQFMRDLKEQGYGPRLIGAIEKGKRLPRQPPVTVETYAWFIKHAADIHPDAYGVVICDEAHTALGERTAATIRRFSRPIYIGMTATDQLLQKHVGDVFPAEVADFPLADAVRRGVVAPLRALRVKPGASLRNVPVVGGDYDQRALAEALDHEALNMAAAMLYRDRFDHRAGIVYAAGVDHAERVAAAMRATGLRARSVSGRTPPRALAATLAAYERGDINVLVNAQLLAEGWNAPRATICMHLAPTASRRVYQQRIGRVMRLHRRKEAGVVVDFVDPAAPHSDRTVTLHSLLDVDLYKPGALVTPKPPRRRQRWRRQARPVLRDAEWLIPVTDDPARRRAVIAEHWKTVSADRLPLDEQEFWAETAARRVAPADLPRLAETLAKVGEATRIRFFATCAAECKHRSLRRIALADLAAHHPDINTIDRMVRLIEAAPTWASDRAQGARVLLSAIAAGTLPGSQSQRLTWTWKLARASRETQYRAATAASPAIRDLLRTLASSRGEEHHVRARLLVASLRQAELPVAAAALAAALTHDAVAARTIEMARADIPADVETLAAAFASNLPEQKAEPPAKARRTRKKRPKERSAAATPAGGKNGDAAEVVGATVIEQKDEQKGREAGQVPSEATSATPPDGSPARKRRRRRRRRKSPGEGGQQQPQAQANGTGAAPRDGSPPAGSAPAESAPAESQPAGSRPAKSRAAKSRPAPKGADAASEAPANGAAAPAKPSRPRRRRTRAVMDATSIGLPPKPPKE
ncbi:MAG TPA: DEAD/DEAH box helicase family protein [Gaiellales bacterium]|nr:DEAD/DEAH box helicase family protein [Gaiellales bacterium]